MTAPTMLVQLTADELRSLLRDELGAALAERDPRPALLTQDALAHELGVSARTLYELRQRGLPTLAVGESPRFDLVEVLAWLRASRSEGRAA